MPFTLSHAAVVLPLCGRKGWDAPALVIGAMIPDAGYYLQRFDLASHCHRWPGLFVLGLPLGWLTWLLCRAAAPLLTAPLPPTERTFMTGWLAGERWSVARALSVSLSLVVGIASHVLLDAFTHESGWAVRHFPLLREPYPGYRLLQHVGSLVGMAVLVAVHGRWRLRHLPPRRRTRPEVVRIAILLLLSTAVALPSAWDFAARFADPIRWRALVFRTVVYTSATAAIGYLGLDIGCSACSTPRGRRRAKSVSARHAESVRLQAEEARRQGGGP